MRLSNGSSVIADRPYFASSVMILGSGTVSFRRSRELACSNLMPGFAVTAILLARRAPSLSSTLTGHPRELAHPTPYWPRDHVAPPRLHVDGHARRRRAAQVDPARLQDADALRRRPLQPHPVPGGPGRSGRRAPSQLAAHGIDGTNLWEATQFEADRPRYGKPDRPGGACGMLSTYGTSPQQPRLRCARRTASSRARTTRRARTCAAPSSFVPPRRSGSPPAAPPRASSPPRALSCRTNRRSAPAPRRRGSPTAGCSTCRPSASAASRTSTSRRRSRRRASPRRATSTCTASYPSPKRASPSRAATSIGSARTATAGRRGCPSSATRRCATSGSTSSSRRWRRPSGASCAARSTSRRR